MPREEPLYREGAELAEGSGDAVAGAAVFGWEDLGGDLWWRGELDFENGGGGRGK